MSPLVCLLNALDTSALKTVYLSKDHDLHRGRKLALPYSVFAMFPQHFSSRDFFFRPPASPIQHVCHGCVHISVPNKGVATAIFILHGFFSPSVPGFSRPRRTKNVFEQSRSTNISLSVIIVVILRGCRNGERKKVVRITRDMIKTRRSVEIARSE